MTKTGKCLTPTQLLICSSFSRENGYLLLICSSLSTSQKIQVEKNTHIMLPSGKLTVDHGEKSSSFLETIKIMDVPASYVS